MNGRMQKKNYSIGLGSVLQLYIVWQRAAALFAAAG